MTAYVGTVYGDDEHPRWEVVIDDGDRYRDLLPLCLDIIEHSPMGFGWGYGGSGPAQLALAILVDAIGPARAVPLYQQFKQEWVAPAPMLEGFRWEREDIWCWAAIVMAGEEVERTAAAPVRRGLWSI